MSADDLDDKLRVLEQRFTQMYLEGRVPWDSGISPPELLEAIQGSAALPAGRALDVGCGTGTNCLTLALAGWRVIGVDFAAPAIGKAKAKAVQAQAELAQAGGDVIFLRADVTQLAPSATLDRMNLILDIGCLNGLPYELRPSYARVMAQQAAPESLFLLYSHLPRPDRPDPFGCTPQELDTLFSTSFILEKRVMGLAPQGGESMWNWLKRRG
jgi:SAM-dependent methyltransferase